MSINLNRRKSVMGRSIKLGHCVCDPKKPCPCETFEKHNVCTCAGERLPRKTGDVALTKFVRKAGCASKIGQADLNRILSKLPPVTDPKVLVGTAAANDAGVYTMDDARVLVHTVDVFSPCVDDPYLFGQIAAANSVSDVYAMGGKPISALSIIGFPIDELDGEIMEQILKGGLDKLEKAGCCLIGGHSINDTEIKCGFAVTGILDSEKDLKKRDAAKPGDLLVLTKPLGTGMISFATQIGRIGPEWLQNAGEMMAVLNRDAAELMIKYEAHAATDITGFALMGHLVEMIRRSGVSAKIDMSSLPVFAAAKICLENSFLPGAIERNQEYSMAWAMVEDESSPENLPILYDPQTSGGLLVAMSPENAEKYVSGMKSRGHNAVSIIGRIVEKSPEYGEGRVIIENSDLRNFYGNPEEVTILSSEHIFEEAPEKVEKTGIQPEEAPCCANPPTFDDVAGESSEKSPVLNSYHMFGDFMKETNKPGLIDKKNKKLMAIALSVARHCEPCLKSHIKTALNMGISKAEIDEAAWLAISFCGCPAMMFYKDVCKELNI